TRTPLACASPTTSGWTCAARRSRASGRGRTCTSGTSRWRRAESARDWSTPGDGRIMEVKAMPTIAIVSAGTGDRDSLCAGLEAEGFEAVVARQAEIRTGELDLVTFLEEHDPQVIVYEVGRPYAQSLTFLRLLQDTAIGRQRAWVLAADDAADAARELLAPRPRRPGAPAPGPVVRAVRRAAVGPGRRPAAAA